MVKINPAEFWADPDKFRGEVSDDFVNICLPEEYFAHKHMSRRIVRAITAHTPYTSTILELGCSVGRNLHFLQQAGYGELTGVEVNPESCEYARKWVGTYGDREWAKIINSSIEDYILLAPEFDVIFTQSVFMHIPPESDWIFEAIASKAKELVVTHEVESTGGFGAELKWSRNYQEVFEQFGLKQIEMTDYSPQTLRVLKKEE